MWLSSCVCHLQGFEDGVMIWCLEISQAYYAITLHIKSFTLLMYNLRTPIIFVLLLEFYTFSFLSIFRKYTILLFVKIHWDSSLRQLERIPSTFRFDFSGHPSNFDQPSRTGKRKN